MALLLDVDQMMFKGLSLVGYTERRQKNVNRLANVQRFQADFGKSPSVLRALWNELQQTELESVRLSNPTNKDLECFFGCFTG